MRSKFDNDLQELFDDYSVPLKDTQWVRMEAAILAKKKSRKKWWIFLGAICLVGMVSFAAGFWLRNPSGNLAQNKSENNSAIQTPTEQYDTKQGNKDEESNKINSSNVEEQIVSNSINGTESDNRIKNVEKPKNTKFSKDVKTKLQDKKAKGFNEEKTEFVKELNNSKDKNPFALSKGAKNLNPNLPKPAEFGNSRPKFDFNFESWKASLYPLVTGFVHPPDFYNTAYVNPEEKAQPEQNNIRKVLMKVKNSLSVDLIAGGFIKNTSFVPTPAGDSAIRFILPEMKTSFEKQLAQGSGSRFGLQLRANVFKGFSIASGFIYQTTRERTEFEHIHYRVPFYDSSFNIIGFILYDDGDAPKSQVVVNNRIDYLQIPLQLRFDQRISPKWRAGLSVSHNFNMPIKFDVAYFNILNFEYQTVDQQMMKLGGSSAAGVHLDYKLWKPIWLGLNYQYTQQKNNVTWQQQAIDLKDINHRINLSLNIKL